MDSKVIVKVFSSAVIKKPWQIKYIVKYLWLCWSGIKIFACIIVTKLIWKWLHCHHVCSLDKDVDRVLHAGSEQQWWWRRWQTLLDRCPLVFPLDIFTANGPHTITSATCKSCTRQQATRCQDSSQNQNQSPSHPPAVYWQPEGPEKKPIAAEFVFHPISFPAVWRTVQKVHASACWWILTRMYWSLVNFLCLSSPEQWPRTS